MKNKYRKEEMFTLVTQWRESGKTRVAFARANNINEKTFDYWCKKQFNEAVKPVKQQEQAVKPSFIEITNTSADSQQATPVLHLELEFAQGLRIKIYR